jgi:catechol 2,3-dioxygenase-like lactoylglutathione lyase family enzyme
MGIVIDAHHMSFPVKDVERSRSFYEGVLGLEQIPRPDLGALRGVWYGLGSCEVHLIEVPEGAAVGETPAKISPIARHSAFAVEDYDATLAHLRSHGLEVVESPGGGQLWVQDPDGHVIEFIVSKR